MSERNQQRRSRLPRTFSATVSNQQKKYTQHADQKSTSVCWTATARRCAAAPLHHQKVFNKTKETLLRKAEGGIGLAGNPKKPGPQPLQYLKDKENITEIHKVLKENKILFQTLCPARLRDDSGGMRRPAEKRLQGPTIRAPFKEQVQQLRRKRVEGRATNGASKAGWDSSYKEKLRTPRRPSSGPVGS